MPRDNDRRVPLIERKITRPFNYIVVGTAILFLVSLCSLPSFLNSGHRAKLAVAEAELRNMSPPLESYFVDHESYPPGVPFVGDLAQRVELTTPVVHISSIPESPVWEEYFMHANRFRILLLSILPVAAIACLTWFALYRRMPNTALVYWWEAVVVWIVGSFFFSLKHEPNMDMFAGAFFIASCFSSLLWIGHYYGRRKYSAYTPPGRAFLLCAILPLLFTLKIAHNTCVQRYAESAIQNARQTKSYLYATDAKSFWILFCTGPDNVYNDNLSSSPIQSDAAAAEQWLGTSFQEYDPTNGTFSTGDIYRASFR